LEDVEGVWTENAVKRARKHHKGLMRIMKSGIDSEATNNFDVMRLKTLRHSASALCVKKLFDAENRRVPQSAAEKTAGNL